MSHHPTPEKQKECAALCREVVGMQETAAVQAINTLGFHPRIRSRDGVGYMGTCDLKADRINLKIQGGVIVSATIG